MALTLEQARRRVTAIRSKTGSKDLDEALRALFDGDFEGEFNLVDLRARSFFYDDFLAAAIEARLSSTAGSGTGNAAATTVAGAMNGTVTMKSASDSGTNAANGTSLTFDQLNWKANQGGCIFEARLQVDVITNCYMFVGFSDTISTTVECPTSLSGTTPASDATDAAGFVFDTAATNAKWHLSGVKSDVDAAVVNSNNAPVAATYQTLRVELDAAGGVAGYINGAFIGYIANALTATVGLTPCIVISNRSATQKIMTLDYIAVEQNR
ncbi:hypothetical protein NKJ71_19435 [Mesorhizobium sp. M0050]|uniref:hypothetical protein n=1 Tax=Mesorhizobium sp. M0050 TaxID=2956861 RepID=UPI00333B7F5A